MRASLLAGVVLCTLATPGLAEEAVPAPGPLDGLDWSHVLRKAATFEVLSSLLETSIFIGFYGGTLASFGGVFAFGLVTAGATYIGHEVAWELVTGPEDDRTDPERILFKTVTYRAVSLARSVVQGALLGGAGAASSAAYAVVVSVADSVLYAGSETMLERLRARGGIRLPTVTLPIVTLPTLTLPSFTMPDVPLPAIRLPEVNLPPVSLPSFTMPEALRVSLPWSSRPAAAAQ